MNIIKAENLSCEILKEMQPFGRDYTTMYQFHHTYDRNNFPLNENSAFRLKVGDTVAVRIGSFSHRHNWTTGEVVDVKKTFVKVKYMSGSVEKIKKFKESGGEYGGCCATREDVIYRYKEGPFLQHLEIERFYKMCDEHNRKMKRAGDTLKSVIGVLSIDDIELFVTAVESKNDNDRLEAFKMFEQRFLKRESQQ